MDTIKRQADLNFDKAPDPLKLKKIMEATGKDLKLRGNRVELYCKSLCEHGWDADKAFQEIVGPLRKKWKKHSYTDRRVKQIIETIKHRLEHIYVPTQQEVELHEDTSSSPPEGHVTRSRKRVAVNNTKFYERKQRKLLEKTVNFTEDGKRASEAVALESESMDKFSTEPHDPPSPQESVREEAEARPVTANLEATPVPVAGSADPSSSEEEDTEFNPSEKEPKMLHLLNLLNLLSVASSGGNFFEPVKQDLVIQIAALATEQNQMDMDCELSTQLHKEVAIRTSTLISKLESYPDASKTVQDGGLSEEEKDDGISINFLCYPNESEMARLETELKWSHFHTVFEAIQRKLRASSIDPLSIRTVDDVECIVKSKLVNNTYNFSKDGDVQNFINSVKLYVKKAREFQAGDRESRKEEIRRQVESGKAELEILETEAKSIKRKAVEISQIGTYARAQLKSVKWRLDWTLDLQEQLFALYRQLAWYIKRLEADVDDAEEQYLDISARNRAVTASVDCAFRVLDEKKELHRRHAAQLADLERTVEKNERLCERKLKKLVSSILNAKIVGPADM